MRYEYLMTGFGVPYTGRAEILMDTTLHGIKCEITKRSKLEMKRYDQMGIEVREKDSGDIVATWSGVKGGWIGR